MGLAGIEPTAYRLGGDRSILLSYNPKQQYIVPDYLLLAEKYYSANLEIGI
jgi:hypothetical protein